MTLNVATGPGLEVERNGVGWKIKKSGWYLGDNRGIFLAQRFVKIKIQIIFVYIFKKSKRILAPTHKYKNIHLPLHALSFNREAQAKGQARLG